MNDVQRLSVLQECLALVRRNRRDSSGGLPAVASSSEPASEVPIAFDAPLPVADGAIAVDAPLPVADGAVAFDAPLAVGDGVVVFDDGAVVFDAPLPVDDAAVAVDDAMVAFDDAMVAFDDAMVAVDDGVVAVDDGVKPGAVSEARAVSPRHATAFDSHEELFRHEETLASDAAGSTLEHEDEDDQRTPSPFRNDSDRPTNPPLSLAQPALFVVPPLPMLPSDWRVDAEVVRELPSEFEEHGFAPVAADALEVPPAAASRTVSRGLDHSMLNPLVESPAFDEAFDVLDFDGELPAARLDSFGDVLDTALSLG